nr:MAG TPA: Baseplate wedge protein [Caudoviricetes sp.]
MADKVIYGITKDGFKRKRLPEILQSLFDRFEDKSGLKVNRNSDSVLGMLFAIVGAEVADVWVESEDSYYAMYPSTSKGVSLTQSAQLAGISPIVAEQTTVYLTCYGIDGTAIERGAVVASNNNSEIAYSSVDSAYITTQKANTIEILVPTSPQNGNRYTLTVDNVTASYTAKSSDNKSSILIGLYSQFDTPQLTYEVNNDVLTISSVDKSKTFAVQFTNLTYQNLGTPILFECNVAGSITPITGDLTGIVTVVSGWNSVTNEVDATVGRDNESDSNLRSRWNSSVYQNGSANVDAIQAAILSNVTGVTACRVFENTSDNTDDEGRPPHSLEAIVQGGDENDIVRVYWKAKGGGIATYGDVAVNMQDSQGTPHTIYFNRPQPVTISLRITLEKLSEEEWSSDNRRNALNAVLNRAQALSLGQDVVLQRFIGDIYRNTTGIGGITIEASKNGGSYSTSNITIGAREVADFDTTRIEVIEHV